MSSHKRVLPPFITEENITKRQVVTTSDGLPQGVPAAPISKTVNENARKRRTLFHEFLGGNENAKKRRSLFHEFLGRRSDFKEFDDAYAKCKPNSQVAVRQLSSTIE